MKINDLSRSIFERLEPRRLLSFTFDVSINPAVTHQEWTGFGTSMVSWKDVPSYSDPEVFNKTVGDLGLNALRLPVWQAFEEHNDNDDPDVFNWDGFNFQSLDATLKFAQEMQKRGADTFLASVWTPPWWMKATSAHWYGGPLRPDMREEFAEYLAAYVITARDRYGIDIDVVSIQNEPQFIEPYESTIYTPQQMLSTMKVVAAKFAREGLTTRLMAPEELSLFHRWEWWDAAFRQDPEVWNSNMVWGTHYTGESHYSAMRNTVRDSGNPLWMTEAPGKDDRSWNGALRISEDVSGMMNLTDLSAYFEWQLDDPTALSSVFQNGQPTPRYHAFKHYAHWIRPGAVRHSISNSNADLDNNNQKDVFATSWYHAGNDARTIVLTNNFDHPVNFKILIDSDRMRGWNAWRSTNGNYHVPWDALSGPNTPSNPNNIQLTLPPRSMVTLYDGQGSPVDSPSLNSARGNIPIVYPKDIAFGHVVRHNALEGSGSVLAQYANSSNIHEQFINGRDGIFAAAASPERGVIGAMDVLIGLGAKVNGRDLEGITPLMVAASTPMTWFTTQTTDPTLPSKKLTTLINAGANIHLKDDQARTALHWAAQVPRWIYSGNFPHDPQVVQTLLQRGADKNKVDHFGRTPLMWAQAEGHYANAQALQDWNQDNVPPELLSTGFDWNHRLAASATFDEAMQAFGASQVGIWRLNSDGSNGTALTVSVNRQTLAGGNTNVDLGMQMPMPNGYFRAGVKSGQVLRDQAGNAFSSVPLGEFWFLNADGNRDGTVNIQDYIIWRENYGQQGVGFAGGDFNYDGVVTLQDYLILRQNFGLTLGPPPSGWGGGGTSGSPKANTGDGGGRSSPPSGGNLVGPWGGSGGKSLAFGSFRAGGAIGLLDEGSEEPGRG